MVIATYNVSMRCKYAFGPFGLLRPSARLFYLTAEITRQTHSGVSHPNTLLLLHHGFARSHGDQIMGHPLATCVQTVEVYFGKWGVPSGCQSLASSHWGPDSWFIPWESVSPFRSPLGGEQGAPFLAPDALNQCLFYLPLVPAAGI